MIIKGQYLGSDKKDYDFTNSDGKQVVGVSNYAFLLLPRSEVKNSGDRLKKVRLEKDFVPVSKVDAQVEWVVDVVGKTLVLVSETIK